VNRIAGISNLRALVGHNSVPGGVIGIAVDGEDASRGYDG